MMFQVAFTTLLLSASTVVLGSPAALNGPDEISAAEDSYCLLRTYVGDTCVGEERNGFLWAGKLGGCKPCGDVEGVFNAFSLQGACPDGTITFYNETGCNTGNELGLEFFKTYTPENETCFPFTKPRYLPDAGGKARSFRLCFYG